MDLAPSQPVARRNGDGPHPSRAYARRSPVPERTCPTRRRRRVASTNPSAPKRRHSFGSKSPSRLPMGLLLSVAAEAGVLLASLTAAEEVLNAALTRLGALLEPLYLNLGTKVIHNPARSRLAPS